MNIRRALAGDAPEIVRIWNAEIQTGFATFTTEEKDQKALVTRVQTPWPFLVAEVDQRVVGFACAGGFRDGPGYAYTAESTVYLAEGVQGRGLGRALMHQLEADLRTHDIHTVVAAISGANTAALAFHQAIGFQDGGILPQAGRKHENWLDLHLLFKHL